MRYEGGCEWCGQDDVCKERGISSCLGEANSSRLFTEALTAEVKTVLADETCLVGAEATLTAALSVLAGTREPDGVVGHGG